MSRPRILLTGATGLLGQRLQPALEALGDCHGLGFSTAPAKGLQVDLTDRAAAWRLLDEFRPAILVHAAALTNVDLCERDPAAAYRLNVEATRHLVDWARAKGDDLRLVYISTDQVYDAPGDSPEEAVDPVHVYALTKLWAEDLVRQLPSGLVLRTNFFGFGDARHRTFVDWVVESCRAGREITLFQDVYFNPLQVEDAASLIARLALGEGAGTYNLGASGGGLSKGRFIRLMAEHLGLPSDGFRDGSLADVGLDARRPRDMRMAVSAIEALLREDMPDLVGSIARLTLERRQDLAS